MIVSADMNKGIFPFSLPPGEIENPGLKEKVSFSLLGTLAPVSKKQYFMVSHVKEQW
jgi:hypothetical protein